ncbi:MAG: aspartate/glutamate racemase family protein, partial [Peptococcales bacterium]
MILKGGYLYYDTPVGIICLDTKFPKPVGHMRNPLTYNFPVVQRVIKDVGVKEILSPSPELIEPFIEAVKQLEQDGVKCITGSCGFMALFQKEIAAAVKIPVLLSSLIQIPLVRVLCGPKCKIGVLTASASSLTPKHFERVGAEIKDVFIKGMEGYSEFRETIIEGKRN